MPRYGRRVSGRRASRSAPGPGKRRNVRGYTLRGRNGRINYVGVSNNPGRRAAEHKNAGKRGSMKVETQSMSRASARRWETRRLATYRRSHDGKNPPSNKSRSG